MFRREMVQSKNDAKTVIDTLFNGVDFTKFTSGTIEFYQDIFANFLPEFLILTLMLKKELCVKRKLSI